MMGASERENICEVFGAIFTTTSKNQADYRVFIEDSEAFADLLIFKEENELFADQQGKWYLVKDAAFADFKIYFTKNKREADFTIYYTETESFAGCN
jgi:hypothetical protein